MPSLFYDIHGKLRVEVRLRREQGTTGAFDALEAFRVPALESADLVLSVEEALEAPCNSYVVNHRHYVAEDVAFSSGRYKNLKYQIRFERRDDMGYLRVAPVFLSPRTRLQRYGIVQSLFLQPFIELELLRRGFIFVHSAAVGRGGRGFLLVGRGGVFKTTLAMWLARREGYDFYGDDKVVLGPDGEIYSYPIFPRIFSFRLAELQTEHMAPLAKVQFLRTMYSGQKKDVIPLRRAPLSKVVFLSRRGTLRSDYNIDRTSALMKIRMNYRLERLSSPGMAGYSRSPIAEVLLAHEFIYPQSTFVPGEDAYMDLANLAFRDEQYREISGGVRFSEDYFKRVKMALEIA